LPEGWTLKIIPPEYITLTEDVIVTEGDEWVTIPPKFKWVDGEIEGYSIEPIDTFMKPPIYKTVTDTIIVHEAYTKLSVIPQRGGDKSVGVASMKVIEEHVPPVTKDVHRRVVKTPAELAPPKEGRKIPYLIENGRTRIVVRPAQTFKREKPLVTKTQTRRIRTKTLTYALRDEKGRVVALIKNFDDLKAFHKTHHAIHPPH